MLRKTFVSIICIALMGFFILNYSGCTDDPVTGPTTGNLALNISGLEDIGSSAIFEGWIIVSGNPVSTGTFTVNSSGQLSRTQFTVNSDNLSNATAFVLTIEPVPDPNQMPSDNKLLAGLFSGNTANLTIEDQAALGTNFSTASGSFILATPTDGMGTNELSGVWFLNPGMPPSQGLQLPMLPSGWEYEGWAVIQDVKVSTGKFTDPSMADQSSIYSGPLAGPPFPGEDFLQNAPAGLVFPTNLQNAMIVITIEPIPDNSTDPFFVKPLSTTVPSDAMEGTSYGLMNNSGMNPAGTAVR
jgi:hypothetical protein